MKYKYDIALSFAEEDRNIAVALSCGLKIHKLKPFYYPDKKEDLLGEELPVILNKLYLNQAKYSIIILSKNYLEKRFCQLELNAIKERMKSQTSRYLVVLKTDFIDPIDIGISNDVVFEEWKFNPEEIALFFKKMLGKKENINSINPFSIFSTKANHIKTQVNINNLQNDLNIKS